MRVRACSRGRRPRLLFAKFISGICDLGPPPPVAATTFPRRSRWARPMASVISILFIVSCANFAGPPEVSPALISNARSDQVDIAQLQDGRRLFLSRCLECHTLPPVAKYSRNEWPHLVSRMAGRANLSPGEQAVITAYLRAASASTR